MKKLFLTFLMFILPTASFAAAMDNLPELPAWLAAISMDNFIPLIINATTYAAAGLYDYLMPLFSAIIGALCVFAFMIFLAKQFFPQNWLSFFGMTGGGGYYTNPEKLSGFALPEKLLKYLVRAAIATTILFALRPTLITDTIIDPFLKVGNAYTRVVMQTIGETDIPETTTECKTTDTKGFLNKDFCDDFANPIKIIMYKNNQIIYKGLQIAASAMPGAILGIPATIVMGANDFTANILNLIVGLIIVFTFFLMGIYLSSLIIQCLLNFMLQIIIFPFKAVGFVLKDSDKWLDIWTPIDGLITALREMIITMIVAAVFMVLNVIFINAIVGSGQIESNSLGDKFMLVLACIMTIIIMKKLFEMLKDKIKSFGANTDEGFYKSITGLAQHIGKTGVRYVNNSIATATKKYKAEAAAKKEGETR